MRVRGRRRRMNGEQGRVLQPDSARTVRSAADLKARDGIVSGQRLIGAHLPATHPERRETRPGRCSGCLTRFVVDVRLPWPSKCPDCGGSSAEPRDRAVRQPSSGGCSPPLPVKSARRCRAADHPPPSAPHPPQDATTCIDSRLLYNAPKPSDAADKCAVSVRVRQPGSEHARRPPLPNRAP